MPFFLALIRALFRALFRAFFCAHFCAHFRALIRALFRAFFCALYRAPFCALIRASFCALIRALIRASGLRAGALIKLKFLFSPPSWYAFLSFLLSPMDHDVAAAEKTHQEAVKELAAASRVATAALDREKNAKLKVKSTQKLLKIAQKNQLKSLSAQHKSAFQIAYKLFGDDLRKHGDKISAKRQGELWQSADQAHWLLKAKSLSSIQIL